MTRSPRRSLALLALAALAALFVPSPAATPPRATPRHALPRAKPGRDLPRAATSDTGRAMAVPAPAKAVFDTTEGDSFADPQLYLAWKAPHGMPGARANLNLTCGDSTEVDTLYLTFETGRDLPGFYGVSAKLRLHPADGDSLGLFWSFGRDGANPGALKIQLDPDGTFPCSQPWVRPGLGAPFFEFHPWVGELSFVYAVPLGQAAPISGRTRYCLARVLLDQRRCHLPGVRQPVCIEWAEAFYSGGGRDIPIKHGSARFVTLNSPDGSVCEPYFRVTKPIIWTPYRLGPEGKLPVRGVPSDSTRR